jgi:transcriptional regulator with XRE-family HTH domain
MDTRNDLREFLTTRRARLTPEQIGLPDYGGRRRVPGLRREEVALVAGMSTEYYIRLERGNATGVSEAVLEGISRALQLDDAERSHLYDLVRAANRGARPQPRRGRATAQQVRPGVRQLLDAMDNVPALVQNGRLDVVAVNRLARAVFSEMYLQPQRPVNFGRFVFLDPRAQTFYRDWADAAQQTVALLRAEAGRAPTTAPSPTSSASFPPAVTPSAPCGHPTTSATTAPASRSSATPSSATSTSATKPWHSPPTGDSSSWPTQPLPVRHPMTRSESS